MPGTPGAVAYVDRIQVVVPRDLRAVVAQKVRLRPRAIICWVRPASHIAGTVMDVTMT